MTPGDAVGQALSRALGATLVLLWVPVGMVLGAIATWVFMR